MPISITVPDGYGYTVILSLGVIPIVAQALGVATTTFRRKAGVPYPNFSATHEQCKSNRAAYQFNASLRSHYNMLENLPQTMASLLFSGLFYPRAAPVLGAIWTIFRCVYSYGYITSTKPDGKGRLYGSGGMWVGQLGLLVLSVMAGLKML